MTTINALLSNLAGCGSLLPRRGARWARAQSCRAVISRLINLFAERTFHGSTLVTHQHLDSCAAAPLLGGGDVATPAAQALSRCSCRSHRPGSHVHDTWTAPTDHNSSPIRPADVTLSQNTDKTNTHSKKLGGKVAFIGVLLYTVRIRLYIVYSIL